MLDLSFLDEDQRSAVTARDGVVKIAAGAGTGKTTTLKYRIAYLLAEGRAQPHEIMAVTFTNKAAEEIRERVEAVVGDDAHSVRMGTFHSLSLRILRKYAEMTGLESGRFTILDDDEVKQVMEEALTLSGAYPAFEEPRKPDGMAPSVHADQVKREKALHDKDRRVFLKEAMKQILRWKECGLHIDEALKTEHLTAENQQFVTIYEEYQELLNIKNMCDFADLLLRVVHLFDTHPDIAEKESARIKYLLVDEFQDTNMLQFRWLKHLYRHSGNLFGVGDFDQSLYSFRGSAPQIMQRLDEEYPVEVVLKTNRRCTQEILKPANMLVDVNDRPDPKLLNSERSGAPVKYVEAGNDFSEVKVVVKHIQQLIGNGAEVNEIAIIARAGYVLKPFEKALMSAGIPYFLTGGTSLLDREEVKDMLAFVKVGVDPYNEIAFQRIANKPSRGLGPTTVKAILDVATGQQVPIHEACFLIASRAVDSNVGKSKIAVVAALGEVLSELSAAIEMDVSPKLVIDMAYEDTGYREFIAERKEDDKIRVSRQENIDFLRQLSGQFQDIVEFMQEFSLMTDAAKEEDGVRISTIHASKGLEYDHIILPAWEQGILPSQNSIDEIAGDIDDPWVGPPIGGIDEERRIAHVALTRARHTVMVTGAKMRNKKRAKPSDFLRTAGLAGGRHGYDPMEECYDQDGGPECSGITFKKPAKGKVKRPLAGRTRLSRLKSRSSRAPAQGLQ
ncbi:ATP-dependent helicase [Salipiger sp. PrR003]|uniref:ATP-dependent helicase n=1 Tax=Salipiger sp. PrR003 TaxID=2706776 RepID=UPI0013DB467F|nr:ATP-dependent helicase [Salipiger sp. PrR003]NDV52898.1 ATP-dependent helicase [Salipiger sp. PrR003]